MTLEKPTDNENGKQGSWLEVLKVSGKLGLTSFGGPAAHLAFFRDEYVGRRKWMKEEAYADLVALSQFLPGPSSSQVGIGVGLVRAGIPGAIAAWVGFTLPSALLLALFAYLLGHFSVADSGWVHGLKIAAVAIVAQAVWAMGKTLAPDRPRALLAIGSAVATLLAPFAWTQVALIATAGLIGWNALKVPESGSIEPMRLGFGRKRAAIALIAFVALLAGLPTLRTFVTADWFALFDSFYRSGSLVFGGGHVVLPLLEREIVPTGWVSREQFLAGYGAAQAVPGPLFTFAAYLGAVAAGWKGAIVATVAIFLPSILLMIGTLPFWETVRSRPSMRSALAGVNAAVVGILLAALYDPVWLSAIRTSADAALALATFGLLVFTRMPAWAAVLFAAACAELATHIF